MKTLKVVIQRWVESEIGWGTRPDGISIHLSMDEYKNYIKSYWSKMPKVVPLEYSREVGNPIEITIVSENIYDKVVNELDLINNKTVVLYHGHPIEQMIEEALKQKLI